MPRRHLWLSIGLALALSPGCVEEESSTAPKGAMGTVPVTPSATAPPDGTLPPPAPTTPTAGETTRSTVATRSRPVRR
jgi:hypothetical protein